MCACMFIGICIDVGLGCCFCFVCLLLGWVLGCVIKAC